MRAAIVDRGQTASLEEQVHLFDAIRKRLAGNMPDEDWACVMQMIKDRFPEDERST